MECGAHQFSCREAYIEATTVLCPYAGETGGGGRENAIIDSNTCVQGPEDTPGSCSPDESSSSITSVSISDASFSGSGEPTTLSL